MDIKIIEDSVSIVASFLTSATRLIKHCRTNKDIDTSKIKIKLYSVSDTSNEYNLYVENISDYNLYDFKLKLKELDLIRINNVSKDACERIKLKMGLLNVDSIPVFTIGQVYETYLLNTTTNKDIGELNFIIQYKLKKNAKDKDICREDISLNIKAFNNVRCIVRNYSGAKHTLKVIDDEI